MRPMRHVLAAVLAVTFLGAPARAEEPQCPLPLGQCLELYSHMRERPWLGVWIEADSTTGVRSVRRVLPGSPAGRAGVRPGDVLESIGGRTPKDFFATRAGWKNGDRSDLAVRRDGREVKLRLSLETIPDEALAELVGAHVLAGHMAYGDFGAAHGGGGHEGERH